MAVGLRWMTNRPPSRTPDVSIGQGGSLSHRSDTSHETANPFNSNRSLAGCERFAHDREKRAALEHLAPIELDHDGEYVGAVESVGPFWLERQFAGDRRLLDHPNVEKEGFRALAREYLDAVIHTAVLVVSTKRDYTSIWRETAAVLNRAHCAAGAARDVNVQSNVNSV